MSSQTQPHAAVLTARTIGGAWLGIAERILLDGAPARWDGRPILEVQTVTLDIEQPAPSDAVINRFADPERLAWMHANFTEHERVAALGGAASYASRLFDYSRSGRDQVAWVIERLRADPERRDAAITTFEPLTDTTYIPCVAMLHFWIPAGRVDLVVFAHSIDFGTKGYANLVELADLQARVAARLGVATGRLSMTITSAHVYDTECDQMRTILAEASSAGLRGSGGRSQAGISPATTAQAGRMSIDERVQQDGENERTGPGDAPATSSVPRQEVNDVLPLPWDEGSTRLSVDELNGEAPD